MAKKKEPTIPKEIPPSWRDPETGKFLKGNEFWKAKSTYGRDYIFKTPAELGDACYQYFEWVEQNPLWEAKVFCFQGELTEATLPKMRAMTIGGMCLFIGMSIESWYEYNKRPEFLQITREVEQIIKDQKFGGAAAELLNANIIARDLGLADKKEHSGKDGGPIKIVDYSKLPTAKNGDTP